MIKDNVLEVARAHLNVMNCSKYIKQVKFSKLELPIYKYKEDSLPETPMTERVWVTLNYKPSKQVINKDSLLTYLRYFRPDFYKKYGTHKVVTLILEDLHKVLEPKELSVVIEDTFVGITVEASL